MRADEVSTIQHIASLREIDLIQYRGIGERSARALHTAAQALTIGAPVWIKGGAKTQYNGEQGVSLFLDLETDPFTQEPWAFAWATPGDKVTIAIVATRRTRREICIQDVNIVFLSRVDAGWSLIATAAEQRPGSICHWGAHERTCLERHPQMQIRAKILPRLRDVHRELKQRVVFPIPRTPSQTNGSLKAIGTWLGVVWPEGIDGGLVVANAFDTWRKSGDANLLNQIISYQRADLDALSRAWHWLQSDAMGVEKI
jgi:predicted RecB family nuclease